MLNGSCKYCGQVQNVEAESQEEADKKATELCGCDEAIKAKQHDLLIKRINELCFASKEDTGFAPIDEDTYKLICILADKVIDEDIEGVRLDLYDRTVKISKSSKGVVKYKQSKLVEVGVNG